MSLANTAYKIFVTLAVVVFWPLILVVVVASGIAQIAYAMWILWRGK